MTNNSNTPGFDREYSVNLCFIESIERIPERNESIVF